MFVDSVTGAIGGSLLKPLVQVGKRGGRVGKQYLDDVYKVGASATDDLIVAGYITAPMISRPARYEFIGGIAAGLVYDIATESSDVGRASEGTVASGGTSSKVMKPMLSDASIRWQLKNGYSMRATTEHACGVGYKLEKVRGRWLCVKKK